MLDAWRPRSAPTARGARTGRRVLRPGQDDHRQVQHAGVQPPLLPGRADQPPGRAAQRVRAVRLPGGRRRPRPDGADARTTSRRWRPAGTSQQVKDIVAETLHELIDPIIYDEAATLIEEHHLAGRDVVIVSSSGAEVVEPIGEMLGADHVIATRMVVEDGRYTGEIEYYAYGETKADGDPRARRDARATTWPQLRLQRLGHRPADARGGRATRTPSTPTGRCAARPSPRDWPVLVFTKPVRLRDRFSGVTPAARRARWPRSRSAPEPPPRASCGSPRAGAGSGPASGCRRGGRATRRARPARMVKKGRPPFPRSRPVRYTEGRKHGSWAPTRRPAHVRAGEPGLSWSPDEGARLVTRPDVPERRPLGGAAHVAGCEVSRRTPVRRRAGWTRRPRRLRGRRAPPPPRSAPPSRRCRRRRRSRSPAAPRRYASRPSSTWPTSGTDTAAGSRPRPTSVSRPPPGRRRRRRREGAHRRQLAVHDGGDDERRRGGRRGEQLAEAAQPGRPRRARAGRASASGTSAGRGQRVQPGHHLQRRAGPGRLQRPDLGRDPQRSLHDRPARRPAAARPVITRSTPHCGANLHDHRSERVSGAHVSSGTSAPSSAPTPGRRAAPTRRPPARRTAAAPGGRAARPRRGGPARRRRPRRAARRGGRRVGAGGLGRSRPDHRPRRATATTRNAGIPAFTSAKRRAASSDGHHTAAARARASAREAR